MEGSLFVIACVDSEVLCTILTVPAGLVVEAIRGLRWQLVSSSLYIGGGRYVVAWNAVSYTPALVSRASSAMKLEFCLTGDLSS